MNPPTNSTEALEATARIIDPGAWAKVDIWRGPAGPTSWVTSKAAREQIAVALAAPSLAKAQAIHEALASTLREENENLKVALTNTDRVGEKVLADLHVAREENARLREGLEKIEDFRARPPMGANGSYQRGYDNGFNNAGSYAQDIAHQTLTTSSKDQDQ